MPFTLYSTKEKLFLFFQMQTDYEKMLEHFTSQWN